MPTTGLEPVRPQWHECLKLACLPIPSSWHILGWILRIELRFSVPQTEVITIIRYPPYNYHHSELNRNLRDMSPLH